MITIKLTLGLDPCEDWAEEELEEYDAEASRVCYEDLCCEAIEAMIKAVELDLEIEELLPSERKPQIRKGIGQIIGRRGSRDFQIAFPSTRKGFRGYISRFAR